MHEMHPCRGHPVDLVRWIPLDRIRPNAYNPNVVAPVELRLLLTSIEHDGYTQPVVVWWDAAAGHYEIVDGFHRYMILVRNQGVQDSTCGLCPCVVIDKPKADRMASTVRHNRARGKHQVTSMGRMVFQMLDEGRTDADVCNELGMEPEELLRLKHVTGFSKLFANTEYRRAWVTRSQILAAQKAGEPVR